MHDISFASKETQGKRKWAVGRAGGGIKNRETKGTSTEMKIRKRSSSLGDRKTILYKKLQLKKKSQSLKEYV